MAIKGKEEAGMDMNDQRMEFDESCFVVAPFLLACLSQISDPVHGLVSAIR